MRHQTTATVKKRPSAAPVNLRDAAKAERRAELQRTALALFKARGYDAVTTSEIASAAQVTERTFFRHFPTKDSVVLWYLDDEADLTLTPAEEQLDARSIATSRAHWLAQGDVGRRVLLDRVRLISSTPALHAQWLEKNYLVANILADRIGALGRPDDGDDVRVMCVAVLAIACQVAESWAAGGGRDNLDTMLETAWAILRPLEHPV